MDNFIREKAMDTNKITREYFDEILVEMRHMDGVKPNMSMTLYGKTFRTPIMMAALSHLKGKDGRDDGMVQMAEAAKLTGSVNWIGMCNSEQFASIMAVDTPSIRIIKPYEDESMVLRYIEQAEELGALAVGMDLDHSFDSKGCHDNVLGYPMRPRSFKEIGSYCKRTKLPFIIKGVISATDAKKSVDAGVGGIVVSHHHGILPTIVPPLMVLPEIAKVINGRMPIFADCGFMNGTDVFKGLALGATAISVGRPIMNAITKNGTQGAADTLNDITNELAGMMARTCSPSIESLDSSLLWHRNGTRIKL